MTTYVNFTKYKAFYEKFGATITALYAGCSLSHINGTAKRYKWVTPKKDVQAKHTVDIYMELLETQRQLDVLKNVINKAVN